MDHKDSSEPNVPVPRQAAPPAAMPVQAIPVMQAPFLTGRAPGSPGIRDHLTTFFKHKYKILSAFVLLTVLTVAGVFIYFQFIFTPIFQARSLILVKAGWENYSADLSSESRKASTLSMNDIMGSELRILQSRELREKVISAIRPEVIYPKLNAEKLQVTPVEAAIFHTEKDLTIAPASRGNIIEVNFKGPVAETGALLVNRLVASYIDKRTDVYKNPKSVLYLDKKAEEFRQKLADAENRLKTFREQNQIVSFDEQRGMLLKQRFELAAVLSGTQNQIKETQERINELEKQVKNIPASVTSASASERRGESESRLLTLQLQEKELLSKFKEDNRLVVNIRNQIQLVKEFLDSQKGSGGKALSTPDPLYQEIQKQIIQGKADLSSLKLKTTATEQQLAALNKDLQALESLDGRYRVLTREVKDNEEKYLGYQQKVEESRTYDELERQKMTSVSVIEPASVPMIPINRPKPLIVFIAIAFFVGLAGSIGMIFLLEQTRHCMTTPAEAEKKLGLQVLATVPMKARPTDVPNH
ncbi:MAG: Wzz/FepE/Etk N-terminal domain-containing protein [Syntrophobacteraceae bacterium]